MGKDYCNFCWAKGSDGKCLCDKESRLQHCKKARARIKEPTTQKQELVGLRDYLTYLARRSIYLKITNGGIPSNEYKYCYLLQKKIKQWGRKHVVFYKYLCEDITVEQAIDLYGVSRRQFYRISSQQKNDLIVFIEEQERLLSEEYPFPTEADIFNYMEDL